MPIKLQHLQHAENATKTKKTFNRLIVRCQEFKIISIRLEIPNQHVEMHQIPSMEEKSATSSAKPVSLIYIDSGGNKPLDQLVAYNVTFFIPRASSVFLVSMIFAYFSLINPRLHSVFVIFARTWGGWCNPPWRFQMKRRRPSRKRPADGFRQVLAIGDIIFGPR